MKQTRVKPSSKIRPVAATRLANVVGGWAPVTQVDGMDYKIDKVEHKLGSDNQN